jgi:hypothetical protein
MPDMICAARPAYADCTGRARSWKRRPQRSVYQLASIRLGRVLLCVPPLRCPRNANPSTFESLAMPRPKVSHPPPSSQQGPEVHQGPAHVQTSLWRRANERCSSPCSIRPATGATASATCDQLWIARISAAALNGITYSRLTHALKQADIQLIARSTTLPFVTAGLLARREVAVSALRSRRGLGLQWRQD